MLPKEAEKKYLAQDIAYYAIPPLKKLLLEKARSAGWPEDVIKVLDITYDGKSLSVHYPDEFEQKVMDLEYGALSSLPNPAIRPFMNRSDSILKTIFEGKIFDDLATMEGVFE